MIRFCRKYRLITLIALFVIWGCLVFGTGLALAQQDESSNTIDLGITYGQQTGLGTDDIRLVIARVIRAALGLLGIIALVIVLYGGYVYMTAAGNEEKVAQAKKILINGTIGLLIILASLAIVQFIFNKLQEATMGGVSEDCQKDGYAQTHMLECFPGPLDQWCKEDLLLCCDVKLNEEGVFFAKSITPVSEDTRMNNVAGRSILSQPINSKFTAGQVLSVKQGDKDITNQFDFSFISNAKGEHIGVEAAYKTGQGLCADGKTPCLENGKYNLEVNKDLTSQSGKKIMEVANEECQFPLSADFTIAHKNKLVLNFDGKDDYIGLGPNPLKDGSMAMEAWIYPTSKEKGFVMAVDSERFYILSQNGHLRFRMAGQHTKDQNGVVTEWHYCDKFAYGVPLNKWSHVVAVYNDATKEQSVYINGALNTNPSGPAKFNDCGSISGGQLEIGRDLVAIGKLYEPWHFPGLLTGVCLYNASLDAATIKAHFDEGLGSCGKPGDSGLAAGWQLDEAWPDKVVDFTGNKQDGVLFGSPAWQLSPYVFPAGKKIKDIVAPFADKIKVNNNIADEEDVYDSGSVLNINTKLTDNSGIGFGSVKIERETKSKGKENIADSFAGPAVKRLGGSDALPDNPYALSYWLAIGEDLKEIAKYTVNIKVFDIDYNFTTASASFIVQPKACEENPTAEGCGGQPGDSCLADWQCGCGKCVKEKCVAQPKIWSINPLKGAEGNYVTIVGKCFGVNKGTVEFGYDSDKDNKITELDKWVDAKVVECGVKTSWYDTWVVVEVPPDVGIPPNAGLPQSSTSSLRVKHNDSTKDNPLLDYSTDGFGPVLGLFEKDNVKRPGLCSVVVSAGEAVQAGATIAPPKTKVDAIGSGFGKSGAIFFGGAQAQYTAWTDKLINSQVPAVMKEGVVAVYVTSTESGQPSNSVPFTIIKAEDLVKDIPVIDQIDPPSTTPKSWITIYGHGFGPLPGAVYLADSAEHAKTCAQTDGKENFCVSLSLALPVKCGNTWSDTQVIAAVPADTAIKKYFLILKNVSGFYSSGEDAFEIKAGDPNPGLCKLEPNFGSAPLLSGKYLNLYGANFSGKIQENNVYFWQNKVDINNVKTWLQGSNSINHVEATRIETAIPADENGLSMQTGPIKVGVKIANSDEALSNSVKYTVTDCRKADKKLEKIPLEGQGLQCCAKDGLDAGQWKKSSKICEGEPREAGYVWRFTTGKIHQLPKVVEQCREIDWDNPLAAVEYPSPVPSDLWTKGKETCLNATIAVRFTVPMDEVSLKAKDNVKVFACSGSEKPDCSIKSEVPMGANDMSMFGSNIFEIRKGSSENKLKPNTWYHVELSDKIISKDCGDIGLTKCYQDNLQKTKPCGEGTAYCFDFKTGEELCTLKNASIVPRSYTVHLLGLVLNPAFPFNSQPPHPFFYFIWGRGSQECVVLNVDGMGWEWGSKDDEKATIVVSPTKAGEKPAYIDSRAEATAIQNAPEGVELDAEIANLDIKETIDVLKEISGKAADADGIVKVPHLAGDNLIEYPEYIVELEFELPEIPTSSDKWSVIKKDDKIDSWQMYRHIYYKPNTNVIFVKDEAYASGEKIRTFFFSEKPNPGMLSFNNLVDQQKFNSADTSTWVNMRYVIKKKDGKIALYNQSKKIKEVKSLVGKSPDVPVSVGGAYQENKLVEPLLGKINKFIIETVVGSGNGITASSTLFIDLYDPEVVKFWPNCLAACVNTGIGVKFNMPMFEPDYKTVDKVDTIKIEECKDGETCADKVQISWNSDITSNEYILRALPTNPADFLVPDTWYLVTISKGVRALNKLNPTDPKDEKNAGKPMKDDFVWKFRTKNDNTPCVVSSVNVLPNPFLATVIWQKTKYTASPISSPDACSPDGQELNPWLYGWDWVSSDKDVATITNFSAITKGSTFCGLDCVKLGSDISSKDNVPYLCGNDELEPGEDCELDGEFLNHKNETVNEEPGVSCSFDCLRPGNLNQAVTTTLGYCGNKIVEPEAGEECDVEDVKTKSYCSANCTWAGSLKEVPANTEYVSSTPICGSGTVTDGEDCDLAIISTSTPESQVGCSSKCLHLGTKLARSWCDDNENSKNFSAELKKIISLSCQKAISVCGNEKLEPGEECELKLDTDNICSDKCLLQNICKVVGVEKCDPTTDGCNDDCTFAGSSLLYKTPSLCGDDFVGTGEDKDCEKGASVNIAGGNPFQIVTAIGNGEVDKQTKTQQTDILATAGTYLKKGKDGAFDVVELDAQQQKTGSGEYNLKCGNTEYNKSQAEGDKFRYNDCQLGESKALTEKGVATNSCCYDRTYRAEEYPANGSSNICRNTFISVDFANHFIDAKSLPGNLTIAVGHEKKDDFSCYKIGQDDVSPDIYTLVLGGNGGEKEAGGFWHNLWSKIKGVFVRLFGGEALAIKVNPIDKNIVWCTSGIKAVPELHHQWSKDLSSVTTTVALYIDTLLPASSTVAVFLRGGNDGIKDSTGIGIRNQDLNKPLLNDVWFFDTGEDICKLKSITVNPDSKLFTKPLDSYEFSAITKSVNGQEIVSISGSYAWKWDWQPQDNGIFDIPAKGSSSSTNKIIIAARNLEGVLVAVANAKVTEDVDQNSQVGQIFTGMTYLEAMFCENPWPPIEVFPFEEGISFGKTKNVSGFVSGQEFNGSALPKVGGEYYNFTMRYCADNNLPYLRPFLFLKEETDAVSGPKLCGLSGKECKIDDDCDSELYNLPGAGKVTIPAEQGVCWESENTPYLSGGQPKLCAQAIDCHGDKTVILPLMDAKYNKVERIVGNGLFIYGITNSLLDNTKKGVAVFDIDKGELASWSQINVSSVKDFFVHSHNLFIIDSEEDQLLIYDISDIKNLKLIGTYADFGNITPELVYVDGYKAYVAGFTTTPGEYGLMEISITEPSEPEFSRKYPFSGKPADLLVKDGYVFALDMQNWKVDATKLSNQTLAPKMLKLKPEDISDDPVKLTGLDVADDRIYISAKQGAGGRLYTFKKQNIENNGFLEPVFSKSYIEFAGEPSGVQTVHGTAYVAAGSAGLVAVNATGDSMSLAGNYGVMVSGVAVGGMSVAFGESSAVTILDNSLMQKNLFCSNSNLPQFEDACEAQGIAQPKSLLTKTLSDETLKRFLFMSDTNDDIIGVQIFANTVTEDNRDVPNRLTAAQWAAEKGMTGFKSAQIGGYDAVTDGNNYYINALNEASNEKIYNNIYQFSINKDAQQSTRQVFGQLLKSLKFNINISDFGFCLLENAGNQSSYGKIPCTTDFDCRDSVGVEKAGTNGECSNKKTELFRDWARLPAYKQMQSNFAAYYPQNGNKYPELKSGTYIPGYTVSMWNSWGTLASMVNGLPTDKINKWVGCVDKKADPQTCWNAASSTFSCPRFASVYEYEFVSSTKLYKFHGPLEYFPLTSEVAKDFINDTFFTTERGCTPLAVYSPFGEKCGDSIVNVGEECDPPGKTAVSNECDHPDFFQAVKTCNASCKWEKGACKLIFKCGNGKVEGNEFCDDGTLNGIYGHCNKDCNGVFEKRCGNQEIDIDEKTKKPLEVCDKADPALQKGYCKDSVFETCEFGYDCQALGLSSYCVSKDEPGYDFKKENSCSWDCQNYGEYCGDKKVKDGLEECDDGNDKLQDGCNNLCQKENMACKNYPAQFSTSTLLTAVSVTKQGKDQEIVIDECKSTGIQICRAYGLYCKEVKKLDSSNQWVNISNSGNSCEFDLKDYVPGFYLDTVPFKGKAQVVCDGEYKGPPAEPPPTQQPVETCGNNKKEQPYKDDTGKEVVEACDLGAQNGVKCQPTYGKSCTYCSSDCTEVLTVDPINYCGNSEIDVVSSSPNGLKEYEACEWVKGTVMAPENKVTLDDLATEQQLCKDKGEYKCENCLLQKQCVDCGIKSESQGGALPRITFINPMISFGVEWPQMIYLAHLFRTDMAKWPNPYLGYYTSFKESLSSPDPDKPHYLFTDANTSKFINEARLETNPMCDKEYGLFFNAGALFGSGWYGDKLDELDDNWQENSKKGDLIPYHVNEEMEEINNEIILSPAVFDEMFRIVVRWTNEDNAEFSGAIFNEAILSIPGAEPSTISYADKLIPYCKQMGKWPNSAYWMPVNCSPLGTGDMVYVHESFSAEGVNTRAQAMTIRTNAVPEGEKPPFAFFVDAIGESIYKHQDSNLRVEVYGYHEGQNPEFSIYNPIAEFDIKGAAGTSSNDSAEYWHVFNLEYTLIDSSDASKGGKYELKKFKGAEDGRIVTDWCEMQQYIPGADVTDCKI